MILFSLPRQVVKMTNVSTDEYFLCIDRVCNHVIFEKKNSASARVNLFVECLVIESKHHALYYYPNVIG